MGVEHQKRLRLALHGAQQFEQQSVFDAVGKIAGVEGVAVVHRVSSGQRGRHGAESGSVSPALRRSIAAQATMTALSVQKRRGGAMKFNSACAVAMAVNRVRMAVLAATPPAMTTAETSGRSCSACSRRSARMSVMAAWKLAAMSAASCMGQSGHAMGGDELGDGGFQAREGEIAAGAAQERAWEREGFGVAIARHGLQRGAAGIGQAEELGGFVESFAGGIIQRRAESWYCPTPSRRIDNGRQRQGAAGKETEYAPSRRTVRA